MKNKSTLNFGARVFVFVVAFAISLYVGYLILYFAYTDSGRRLEPRSWFLAGGIMYLTSLLGTSIMRVKYLELRLLLNVVQFILLGSVLILVFSLVTIFQYYHQKFW